MAYGVGRSFAPGVTVYEDAIPAYAAPASFNTVYMMVDAPDDTSVTVFPYNRPIPISSLNEYENLISELPTTGGPELTSYYSVKAFFQQVTNPDLRVCRVGTPGVIQELAFNPAARKDDGVNVPSNLVKGDLVYLKIFVNDIPLGEKTPNGGWLGVPVEIPANFVPGDVENNLQISVAMRDAVVAAINADADISAGAYVRETGEGDPACDECAYLYLTGRVFNSQVELVPSFEILGNQFVMSLSAYSVENVTAADQSVYDWIQCARTGFEDPNLPQGYLCAPAAFSIYGQADRVNLGQTMEEVCSDANHKWMAMIDCGPYYVTSVETYKEFLEHSPADGFDPDGLYLVENVIYRWTDTEPVRFTEANYDPNSEWASANPELEDGDRRALKDNRILTVTVPDPSNPPISLADNTITLTQDWPVGIKSGEKVEISLSFIADIEDRPVAPTYSDVFTEVVNEDLIGTFYVIAADIDESLAEDQIKLASSRTRALGNDPIDIVTAGTAGAGGVLLDIKYTTVAWEFNLEIKGKTSNLIEVNNNDGASFNTLHLPGTLQKPSAETDFQSQIRRLVDPSKALMRGGRALKYFASASLDDVNDEILFDAHGLQTGDECYLYQVPSATLPSAFTSGNTLFAIRVDENRLSFATSPANAEADVRITFTDDGTDSASVKSPRGAAVQGILTTGGDIVVFSADHGLKTTDQIMFNGEINTDTTTIFEATTAETINPYYVWTIDRNIFQLAPSASNLAAEVFTNWPLDPIVTTDPVDWYRRVTVAPDGGVFSDVGVVRWLRGRKYQLDCTLAVYNVKDEAGVPINTNEFNPYTGAAYTIDLSTDFRLSNVREPAGVPEYRFAAPTGDFIAVTSHGYTLGAEVRLNEATGALLATPLEEGKDYYVTGPAGIVDPDQIYLSENLSDAVTGTFISLSDPGTVNADGIQGLVTLSTNPFTYQYTEDARSYPLNPVRDFAGENNFYCVPLSYGDQKNEFLTEIYGHACLDIDNVQVVLYGAYVELEFVESNSEPPNSIWNFDCVTSQDLIDEGLRGVNNNGIPQVIAVEKGMDSHSRLFEESQKYFTTQGFLAYYAPYIKNDVGVFIPPTPYVTGFAMKRYREEIAGFRLPPAGIKYTLAGARGVQVEITTGMQNVSNPYGLNALRQLPGYSSLDPDTGETYGPVFIWGSRTRINPADNRAALYKFVNTRVIMNVIYGTLRRSLDSQIFSVIDGRAVTFNQIRTIVANTLYENFYVPGALFGATASEAFDVIVDDRNNPPSHLEDGLVNVQVFVVPVPTLERIEIDLLRVSIGGIKQAQEDLGYLPYQPNRV
jgi:hypothetical protein